MRSHDVPFVIGVVLMGGEFGYAIYLTVAESHTFALYLAIRYATAEQWSPVHWLKEQVQRRCWKHIPLGQCIPVKG